MGFVLRSTDLSPDVAAVDEDLFDEGQCVAGSRQDAASSVAGLDPGGMEPRPQVRNREAQTSGGAVPAVLTLGKANAASSRSAWRPLESLGAVAVRPPWALNKCSGYDPSRSARRG